MEATDPSLTLLDENHGLKRHKRKVDLFRICLHLLYWGWGLYSTHNQFDRIMRQTPEEPANLDLIRLVWYNHFLVTITTFYLLGYFVVPPMLEQMIVYRLDKKQVNYKRLGYVVLAWASVYGVYNINIFYLFRYISTHFSPVPPYVIRNFIIMKDSGPLSVYTDYSVAMFVWAYHISYMLQPLLYKIIREAVVWGADGVVAENTLRIQEVKTRQLIASKLSFLRQQINPHFLFNMLNNIHGLINKANGPAASLLAKLSYLLRYSLKESKNEWVLLEKEVQFMTDYIEMEKTRHFNAEAIQFQKIGSPSPFSVPPLLLVTFIENAFKHGLNASYDEGWVRIKLEIDHNRDRLIFEVANNMAPAVDSNLSTGVGLISTQQRMELLFPAGTYSLEVQSDREAYQVHLEFPLKREPAHEFEFVN